MLWLQRLAISGFGPFVEDEVIEFPDKPGVLVVYGENMRGKSSLVDAIRYAFYGTLYARGARARRRLSVCNRELAAAGRYGFSVVLSFRHDDADYQLVRRCDPRVPKPQSDDDFTETVLVRRGSSPLGPQEAKHLLAQVLPAEVSRFFLFDGELLQQYEDLLMSESDAGRKLSEAIERILGVPILKNARAHLNELASQAERVATQEASKHQESQALATAYNLAVAERDAHEREVDRLIKTEAKLTLERVEVEEFLSSRARYADALDDLKRVEGELDALDEEGRRKSEELRAAMADSWRTLLAPSAVAARKKIQAEAEREWNALQESLRRRAIEDGHCGTCDQDVPEAVRQQLQRTLSGAGVSDGTQMGWAMARLSDLNRYRDFDNSPLIREIWARLEQIKIAQVGLDDQAGELRHELEESNPEVLTHMKATLSEVTQKLAVTRKGIDDEGKEVVAAEGRMARLVEKMNALGLPSMKESQRRAKFLRDSAEVLACAIEQYKAALRSRVEKTASDLFLSMTTEKTDYARLSINDGYGLNIIHVDGQVEEARSAGAEHVVALALMGALHANAPLHGPIVMDSPFGRLDEQHTENVVTTLPDMAKQIVLLVFESEVGTERMRQTLGPALCGEYKLLRHSARHTEIREMR